MINSFQYCLVSVIIPVFNAKKYLSSAIRSLRKQTISQEQIEVLLIDDGSTDGSAEVCDRYAQKYNNIRVFHQENKGVSAARNKGIMEARGKYLAFLDADDWLSKEALKNVRDFFEAHYDETDVVGFKTIFYYSAKNKQAHPRDLLIQNSGIISCNNKACINLTRLTVLVKNRGEDNVFFSTELSFHEDEDYLVRALARCANFGYVKEACYFYRQNTGGATDTVSSPEWLFAPSTKMYQEWLLSFQMQPEMNSYVQNAILNDFAWKLRDHKLLPNHLSGPAYSEGVNTIRSILEQIEYGRIVQHPSLDYRDRFFLVALRGSPETNKEQICTLFLTSYNSQMRESYIIGMLSGLNLDLEMVDILVGTADGKKKIPIICQRFPWRDRPEDDVVDSYYGFIKKMKWDETDVLCFFASYEGHHIPLTICYGPDACTDNVTDKDRNIKIKLLNMAITAIKLFSGRIWLYHGCPETFHTEKTRKDGIHRFYIAEKGDKETGGKRVVPFRSKTHRLLFLMSDKIILNSPWQSYVPFYEPTYKVVKATVEHGLIVAEHGEGELRSGV